MNRLNVVIFEAIWLRNEGAYRHMRLNDKAKAAKKDKFNRSRYVLTTNIHLSIYFS